MKKCFKCKNKKPLDMFYRHKGMVDGRLNKCKECTKEDSANNKKNFFNNKKSYDKTEKGVIRVIYKTQKGNSKRRKHNPPTYTKDELKEFMYKNNFKVLYNNWVESNYDKKKKPSIDRIDDFKGYSIGNIQLTTWELNKEKQTQDILIGRSTSGVRCKPVLCFDKDGKLVAEYVSYSSAKRAIGYNFEKPLKTHKPDRTKGFIWYYKEDYKKTKGKYE